MSKKNPRIILIHGLGGKPPKAPYLKEWIASTQLGVPSLPSGAFRMAYWADLRGETTPIDGQKEIVDLMPRVQKDLLVRVKSQRTEHLSWWEIIWGYIRHHSLEVADPLIKQFLERSIDDVYNYFYRDNRREQISQRLRDELKDAEGRKVAVVSHSMGTIIALDVLKDWGSPVDQFITMGSPLGLAWIRHKIGNPGFPNCVKDSNWLNVYDGSDPVTMPDQNIANDYISGWHFPTDKLIRANYSQNGIKDPHHWHGYLSSPPVAARLLQFWNSS